MSADKLIHKTKNSLRKMRNELDAVKFVWKTTKADQSGWTHEYMQKMRDFVRFAPVTTATVMGVVVVPATILAVLL